ncbi:hypothetical protein MMH89_01750 [Candidatus Comchoanobacter bicostacola]|uniref:Uncharacterized protein n=1 Tax=Candidatus Comchoanobacter bicostacola TaxID=2919598 RepID=A0ABY5DN12_9GAMM|nr:hypothetical protein [Candidatus Comchoanobacter bicostacola]UTC24874.1 hypothetical protein MMH89_01750 [Candidatus Comchoanobacter bicostacola]
MFVFLKKLALRFWAWLKRLFSRTPKPEQVSREAKVADVQTEDEVKQLAQVVKLFERLKDPADCYKDDNLEIKSFLETVYKGNEYQFGMLELQAEVAKLKSDPKALRVFLQQNIMRHKRGQKGLDWYFAPHFRGSVWNLNGRSKEVVAAISDNRVVRNNFRLMLEIIMKLHTIYPAHKFYKVRLDKFYWSAFQFFNIHKGVAGSGKEEIAFYNDVYMKKVGGATKSEYLHKAKYEECYSGHENTDLSRESFIKHVIGAK